MRARWFSHSWSISFPCTASVAASSAIAATTRSGAFPVSIKTRAWRSPSSPTAKACVISKPAGAPSAPSSTTWAFADLSRGQPWPTPTSRATGASTPTSPRPRSASPDASTSIELFFKWIKQHLRIKRFFGTSENAVKTQVWIAVSVYVPVAIIKKRLDIDPSLYTILPVLSLTIFEKTSLLQVLRELEPTEESHPSYNQLNLFD